MAGRKSAKFDQMGEMRRRRGATLVFLVGVAWALAGCQEPGFARAQWNSRLERMRYPVDRFVQAEERRPGNLDAAGAWIRETIEYDVEKTRRNVRGVGEWYQYDVNRFQQRLNGPYQHGLNEMFGGKPKDIEPNAIQMFF